jgi:hypothetical protein
VPSLSWLYWGNLSFYLLRMNCIPFRSTSVQPGFLWGSWYSIFSFMCMFCRSSFVLLFFCLLCCRFFFDTRILITPLVSSNSSFNILCIMFKILAVRSVICEVGLDWFMIYNATFNSMSVILWRSVLLVEETGVPGEKKRLVASHWQSLSHNFVSTTHRHERDWNSQG